MCPQTNFDFPFFVGHGYDIHVFDDDPQRALYLGGVLIPNTPGLKAHSDGDVVIHALCDALLGAGGWGDIGCLFPDTDQQFHNIDSKILLKQVVDKVDERGYRVVNADMTILCQRPKLSSFFPAIRACLKELLLGARVNVKATTTEGMNDEGQGKCISAHAVCSIVHKNLNFSKKFD